ncbi:MAG: hypothetical protein ACFE0Q_02995 [Anaerolineae bacterium]
MKKAVADMTPEEYIEYLNQLSESEFMTIVAHDVKKVVSVAHGYLSLLRLDIEEGLLEASKVEEYIDEMEDMFEKSYIYIDAAQRSYQQRNDE